MQSIAWSYVYFVDKETGEIGVCRHEDLGCRTMAGPVRKPVIQESQDGSVSILQEDRWVDMALVRLLEIQNVRDRFP